ncbi:catalase A [Ciborinia camelliae]|nr:catalase A [Ciborinia camelliae]
MAVQEEQYAFHEQWVGNVTVFESFVTDDDFVQPREYWLSLADEVRGQENMIHNIAASLYGAEEAVRNTTYTIFTTIDQNLGQQLRQETEMMVINDA